MRKIKLLKLLQDEFQGHVFKQIDNSIYMDEHRLNGDVNITEDDLNCYNRGPNLEDDVIEMYTHEIHWWDNQPFNKLLAKCEENINGQNNTSRIHKAD